MESWRQEWRAIAPSLPTVGLEQLRTALLHNSTNLVRGMYVRWGREEGQGAPPIGVCALTMCQWGGRPFDASSRAFASMIRDHFSVPLHTLVVNFVAWFDQNHKDDYFPPNNAGCGELSPCAPSRLMVFRELLPEVSRELARRQPKENGDGPVATGMAGEDRTQTILEGP